MADVVKLQLAEVGEAYKFDVAEVLQSATEAELTHIVVVGYDADGHLRVFASDGIGESVVLLERAKLRILD